MQFPLANLLGMDPMNWALIAVVALLLFGKRLPEVGRSLGKGIVEFKKGLAGVGEDIQQSTNKVDEKPALPPGSKFDPYTGKPIADQQMRFDPYTGKPLNEQQTISQGSSTSNP